MQYGQSGLGIGVCLAMLSFPGSASANGKYDLRVTPVTSKGKASGMRIKGNVTFDRFPRVRLSLGRAGKGLPAGSDDKRKAALSGGYLMKTLGNWSGRPQATKEVDVTVKYDGKTFKSGAEFDLVAAFTGANNGMWKNHIHVYGMVNGPVQSGKKHTMP